MAKMREKGLDRDCWEGEGSFCVSKVEPVENTKLGNDWTLDLARNSLI